MKIHILLLRANQKYPQRERRLPARLADENTSLLMIRNGVNELLKWGLKISSLHVLLKQEVNLSKSQKTFFELLPKTIHFEVRE